MPLRRHDAQYYIAVSAILLNFFVTLGILFVMQYQSERADTRLCESTNQSRAAFRGVLVDVLMRAAESSANNPDATPAQRERARVFYQDAVDRIERGVVIIECPPGPRLAPWQ